MAALSSRPSLRSSNRNKAIPTEVPPTHADQNLANPQRGKRNRDSSLHNQSNVSVKRLRLALPGPTSPTDDYPTHAPKSLPIRDRSATQDAVTQVGRSQKPDPPQRINGTTVTIHNAQVFNNNNASHTDSPTNVSSQNDKRSLRSHDGCSRSKSELALYFPNYDDLVSIEPKEPGRTPGSIGRCQQLIHNIRTPYSRDPHSHYRRPCQICAIYFNLKKCQQRSSKSFQWETSYGQWLFSRVGVIGRDLHHP